VTEIVDHVNRATLALNRAGVGELPPERRLTSPAVRRSSRHGGDGCFAYDRKPPPCCGGCDHSNDLHILRIDLAPSIQYVIDLGLKGGHATASALDPVGGSPPDRRNRSPVSRMSPKLRFTRVDQSQVVAACGRRQGTMLGCQVVSSPSPLPDAPEFGVFGSSSSDRTVFPLALRIAACVSPCRLNSALSDEGDVALDGHDTGSKNLPPMLLEVP
jgi:hypothetical protein